LEKQQRKILTGVKPEFALTLKRSGLSVFGQITLLMGRHWLFMAELPHEVRNSNIEKKAGNLYNNRMKNPADLCSRK